MYRIVTGTSAQFTVLDSNDQPAFIGSLDECRDWLDQNENLSLGQATFVPARPNFLRRVWRWFKGHGTRFPNTRNSAAGMRL